MVSSFHNCRRVMLVVAAFCLLCDCPKSVDAAETDFISSSTCYVDALSTYVQTQQHLSQLRLAALKTLKAEGHASEKEVDAANLDLQILNYRLTACSKFKTYLGELESKAASEQLKETDSITVDLALLTRTSLPSLELKALPLSNRNRRFVEDYSSAEQAHVEAQAEVIQPTIDFLREHRSRISKIKNPMQADLAMIQQLDARIAVLIAEVELIRATPSAFSIGSTVAEVRAVKRQWNAIESQAEANRRTLTAELLRVHRDRLAKLEATGLGRPCEFRKVSNQLNVMESEEQIERTAVAPINVDRLAARIAKVERIAEAAPFFAAEYNRLLAVQRCQQAEVGVAKAKQARVEAWLAESETVMNAQSLSTLTSYSKSRLKRGSKIMAALSADASVEQADANLQLAKLRRAALQQLFTEGFASWKETAHSAAQVEMWTAKRAAAECERQVLTLASQLVQELANEDEWQVSSR